jgi:hypothetical protein
MLSGLRSEVWTGVSVVMVDVTPIGATARHLPLEQLGALALAGDALVKLRHLGLLVLLKHGWMRRQFPCRAAHQSNRDF